MKRLLILVILTVTTLQLSAETESSDLSKDQLQNECAKGNTVSCSMLINGNSQLSEIKQKLEEKKWLEEEQLGITLLPLYLECTRTGKHCKKFIKQVQRLELYKKTN